MLKALQQKYAHEICLGAACALVAVGNATVIRRLLRSPRTKRDARVRRTTAMALGRCVTLPSWRIAPLGFAGWPDPGFERFKVLLGRRCLRTVKDAEVVDVLADCAVQDRDSSVRAHVATALGAVGSERALNALLTCARGDTVASTRKAAVLALGRIANSKALTDVLTSALVDSDKSVRQTASYVTLREIAQNTVADTLLDSLPCHDDELLKHRNLVESICGRTGRWISPLRRGRSHRDR